jgi:hypothetical protein
MDHLLRIIQRRMNKWFPPNIERGKYYTICNYNNIPSEAGTYTIEKGPYRDTVFTIENVRIGDEAGSFEAGLILFDRKIIFGGWTKHDFTKDPFFDTIVDRIFQIELRYCINNYANVRKEVLADEDDRTDYIEEPVAKRTVRKKSNSVPKKRILSKQKRKTNISGSKRVLSKVRPPNDHGSDSDIFSSKK